VWKTGDGGLYWENVSDGFFKRASVGAIAVSRSDPNVIYVGMGESCIRGNVSHGDGVYRSTDAGKTWTHLGLEDTRNIGQVRVHPEDHDTVYVAALGHAHGANNQRGVYRSRDGGKIWKRVLYRSDRAGAIDISMDPNNPRILYATIWEAVRRPHELVSGGPGSGIFRSNDAGDTWTEISHARVCPKGTLGKIGIAVSPAKSGRVFAIVEAEDGAVFRSDDGGDSWERGSEDRNLRQRAWYYHHIFADPKDPETAWVLNVDAWRSSDGGKTFVQMSIPHGDHHDLWIDPNDPNRNDRGQRRRCGRVVQRRRELVRRLQPADRGVLSRHHRQPDAVPHLRRAAGQHHDDGPEPRADRRRLGRGLVPDRRRRVGLHRGPSRRSEHRVSPATIRDRSRGGTGERTRRAGSWCGRSRARARVPTR
jgi:photosystem II stability/assembly factor-like uncharacterized protein